MRTSKICLLVAIISGLLAMPMIANAAWTTLDGQAVGEGIDYQQFSSGGCTVHVTRMPIGDDNYAIQACSARQSVNYPQESGGETGYGERIQDQIDWYHTSMNNYDFVEGGVWTSWWRKTSNIIAAINGGPHNNGGSYGVTKGHMESGYCDSLIPDMSGLTGFIWTGLRQPVIGGCLDRGAATLSYGAYSSTVSKINSGTAGTDEFVVFTPRQKGFITPARGTAGKEVVVRYPERCGFSSGNITSCYVWALGNDYGETWIPFDSIVLSGSGTEATKLATLSVGDTLTFSHPAANYFTEEQDPGYGCVSTDTSVDWDDVFAYAGGTWRFLEDDTVLPNPSDTNADYRTAVAYNSNYVYFVVVEEPGMDLEDLGDFCKDTADIDATDGIALDGGANSQMVANDSLITTNTSAYSTFGTDDAPVADGLMMARIVPMEQSSRVYKWDEEVDTVSSCDMRVGPGNNYPVIQTVPSDVTVTIRWHPKYTIKSTGKYWVYAEYNGERGWIWDDCLEECIFYSGGETQVKDVGENGSFIQDFSGSYENFRWQKLVAGEWVDVQAEEGHIAFNIWQGLQFTGYQVSDEGWYRFKSDSCTSEPYGLIVNPGWASLDGESIGEGIEYREFWDDGNKIRVTRMPQNRDIYAIEACSARRGIDYGDDDGLGQTVLDQTRYYSNNTINRFGTVDLPDWWPWVGRRSTVYAAINGGPFNSGTATGLEITKGHIQQGSYAKRMSELGGLTGFLWGGESKAHIGGCVDHGDQIATYGAYSTAIARVNDGTAEGNELVLFTSQAPYSRTPARGSSGTEVVVLSDLAFSLNTGNTTTGYVDYIGDDDGETWIPFDGVVLSGSGTTATALATLSVGNTVTISQAVTNKFTEEQDPGYGCVSTDTSVPWNLAYSYVGGTWRFLEDDVVLPDTSDTDETYRTAVAYNSDWVYFVTADTMNAEQLGYFCRDNSLIDATDGILLDGGASTQMVVNGMQKVSNGLAYSTYGTPQAPVADGLMMTKIDNYQTSGYWYDNDISATIEVDTVLSAGPGDSYPAIAELDAESTVTTRWHPRNGLLSNNYHWRYVEYGGQRGWVEEECLECLFIRWHPGPITANLYDEDRATGCGVNGRGVSCQWQKYISGVWTDISDDPDHIHGTDSVCLVFDVIQTGDDGQYRCKLTSDCDDTLYTDAATVTIL